MSDNTTIRFIDAGRVSFIRSQTIYHALGYAQTADTPDTIVLVRPDSPYMCLGFFQDAATELDLDFCKKIGLPIVRREQGGGCVYIDDQQLFVQWIFQQKSLPLNVGHRFRLFVKPLIETYKKIGIDAYFHPINDVHVNGKKIVGTGAARIGSAEIITGNFLFDFNFGAMARALNVPNDGFRGDFSNCLRQYLTTIKKELGVTPKSAIIKKNYVQFCEKMLHRKLVPGQFTQGELQLMSELDEKMQTDEWLFQHQKPSENFRMVKIHGAVFIGASSFDTPSGKTTVRIRMKDNLIEAISIEGLTSFFVNAKQTLEQVLTGAILEEKNLTKQINKLKTTDYWNEEEAKQLLSEIIKIKKLKPAN